MIKRTIILIVILIALIVTLFALEPNFINKIIFSPNDSDVTRGVSRESDSGETGKNQESEEEIEVLAENLSVPWEIIFMPDESILLTERSGDLVHLESPEGFGQSENSPQREMSRIETSNISNESGEGGLLGATLHPDFEDNNWLYLYMTYQAEEGDVGETKNRVLRFTFENNELNNQKVIIDDIPGASYHDGGRIAFGPDDLLYITTGEAGVAEIAQDLDSLGGKILRLDENGEIPDDNPFENSSIYSYGHRNPQGLAWDSSGQLWSTEHGRSGVQSGLDELNKIEAGGNYGWPTIEGDETRDGMITPSLHSGPDETWAPASLAFRDGVFYWGGLRGNSLYEASLGESGESVNNLIAHFRENYGRIRAVAMKEDRIYMTTSNTDGRGEPAQNDDRLISVPLDFLKG